jgi:hypothetical protein
VKNSKEFIDIIKSLRAGPVDILLIFEVVSLFGMVPIGEAVCLLTISCDSSTVY